VTRVALKKQGNRSLCASIPEPSSLLPPQQDDLNFFASLASDLGLGGGLYKETQQSSTTTPKINDSVRHHRSATLMNERALPVINRSQAPPPSIYNPALLLIALTGAHTGL